MEKLRQVVKVMIIGLVLLMANANAARPSDASMHPNLTTTLPNVIRGILGENPSVLAARASQFASHYGWLSARGGYFPVIDVEVSQGKEYSESQTSPPTTELERKERSVTVSENIFNGGLTYNTVKQDRYQMMASTAELHKVQQSVSLAAIQAYIDVLRFRRLRLIAQQNVAAHLETLRKVGIRTAEGAAAQTDMHLTRARVSLAQTNLVSARKNLRDANTIYQAIIGYWPALHMAMPRVPYKSLPHSYDEAVAFAEHHQPSLKVAAGNYLARKAGVGVARAAYYPTLDATFIASRFSNLNGVAGYFRTRQAMLTATYNIFRGGSDYAGLHQAQELRLQAMDNLAQEHRTVHQAIGIAWNTYREQGEKLSRLSNYAKYSSNVVRDYKKRFVLGQPLFDLLDAEKELFDARSLLTNARFDRMLSTYAVLETIGHLIPVVLRDQHPDVYPPLRAHKPVRLHPPKRLTRSVKKHRLIRLHRSARRHSSVRLSKPRQPLVKAHRAVRQPVVATLGKRVKPQSEKRHSSALLHQAVHAEQHHRIVRR